MTNGIEIHFDAEEGHLRLDCSDEAFCRIRDLVVSGSSTGDRLDAFLDGIRSIVVRRVSALDPPGMARRGLRLVAVWLALGVSLGIWVVGLIAVIRLLLGRGS